MPNQPKTPIRGFRIPDELYRAAREVAEARGEDLASVVRAALERYVKRNRSNGRTEIPRADQRGPSCESDEGHAR